MVTASHAFAVGTLKNPVQDQTPEFQIQQEDFPALPGAQSKNTYLLFVIKRLF